MFFSSNPFSPYKNLILMIPLRCAPRITISRPPILFSIFIFFNNNCPINEAERPRMIKTREKPATKISEEKSSFFFPPVSAYSPSRRDIYDGTRGKTHGEKKEIKPAPKAINMEISGFTLINPFFIIFLLVYILII